MPGFELIGDEEKTAVVEVFDDGGALARTGGVRRSGRHRVQEFEQAFADYMGVKHALAVSSGTAALKVSLASIGIKPGDEVITQAFTFVATVEAIVEIGATPVLVNVDDTLNMNPSELERVITSRTKAIIPVHMLGVAADIESIIHVAKQHNLIVLEDNCEALGATWSDRMLGTQGNACAFSFDFGKIITTGEGGMITTDDDQIHNLAREYHDHGHENNPNLPRGRDSRNSSGFNYRMTEIQAAIGLAQMSKLDVILETNRRNYSVLYSGLKHLKPKGLQFRRTLANSNPACDALIFQLPTMDHAEALVSRMTQHGLGTKNLPDAIDWHFAGTWGHIFQNYGISKGELWEITLPTYERLARCIAVPIMVSDSVRKVQEVASILSEEIEQIL